MKIGNWKITDRTLEYQGKGPERFVIEKDSLLKKTTEVGDSVNEYYEWLVRATAEEWLDEDDLYDLNFAFVYVAGTLQSNFEYSVLDNTLEFQYNLFEEEDEEDEE